MNDNRYIVVAELQRKRSEILQRLRQLRTETKEICAALVQVRRAIARLLPRPIAFSGLTLAIRTALAQRPVRTREITLFFMGAEELDTRDKPLYRQVRERVHRCLQRLKKRGAVVSERRARSNMWAFKS